MVVFFIGLDNLNLEFSFTSNNMVGSGYAYGIDENRSSGIEYLQNISSSIFLNSF